MSVITANPSVISAEGRSRLSSKHARNYQKISEVNLDEKAILSYLRSHNLYRTLATFVSESHFSQNIQPLMKIIEAGGAVFEGNIEKLLNSIWSQCQGKQNDNHKKRLMVQFYLHIWLCVGKGQLEKERIHSLKEYINLKGDALSEVPELLPYFALPYAENPMSHPFLKRIFAVEWREELQNLILDLTGRKQEHKNEEEWLNIIEDMIEICAGLYSRIDPKNKVPLLEQMIERVSLYKYVIDKNKDIKFHQQQKQASEIDLSVRELDFGNVEGVKRKIAELQKQLVQNRRLGSSLQLSIVHHGIQGEIAALARFKQDKKYVKKLIANDIFCLADRYGRIMEYQELKLLELISNYYEGRSYLQSYLKIASDMSSIVGAHFKQLSTSQVGIATLTTCFNALRKLTIRHSIFNRIVEQKGFIQLVLRVFETLRTLYLKGGKERYSNALLATADFLTQIIIHKKGRQIITATNFLEGIVDFFKQMKTRVVDERLQKVLCSSIYLLLVETDIRVRANNLKVKDILLDRMLERKSECYQAIVGYIIQRMEMDEEIEEGESDQDEEKSIQFDEGIKILEKAVYHRGEKLSFQDIKSFSGKKKAIEEKKVDLRGSKEKGKIQKKSTKKVVEGRQYSRQKYEWKGSKSNLMEGGKGVVY